MPGNRPFSRRFAAAVLVAALGSVAFSGAAEAQRTRGGNFFQQLFGGGGGSFQRPFEGEQPAPQTDYSRAPPPHKPDAKTEPVVPTTSILVMGDAMADWLAYGLEDAFSDTPEIAVIRNNKRGSGLLRYEYKSDLDWWHAARDILAKEKADYVVMMMGVSDHQNISERDLAKEADQKDAEQKAADDNTAPNQDQAGNPENSIIAPEPKKKANGVVEFRSDKWAEIYSRRIDATVAALKSKGVPVFWVGLPAIRGTKATADAVYLNDLYRARVERAGAVYIDVWDGFVDETGKFTMHGPDLEGQVRRLRSWDGVYFTTYGARKLAHYVEREIRRYMSNRAVPVMLPAGPVGPTSDLKSTVRPLAGPVLPLTVTPGNANELAGGGDARPTHSDAIAASVLVKGDPVVAPAGRADDFSWPRNGAAPAGAVSAAATAAPPEPEPKPKAAIRSEPKPQIDTKTGAKAKSTPVPKVAETPVAKPKVVAEEKKPKPQPAPRPPRPVIRNPFETLFGR